jgi:hypothetical protein
MSSEELPAELVWRGDGHLSDEALDAVADGEESLLPEQAAAHLDGCTACAGRLGEAALLTLRVSELVRASAPPGRETAPSAIAQTQGRAPATTQAQEARPSRARPRAPLPIWPLAAAVIVAALGAVPSALAAAHDLPAFAASVQRAMPLLAHGAVVLLRHGGEGLAPLALGALVVSALTLLVASVSMVRALSRKAPVEGGV